MSEQNQEEETALAGTISSYALADAVWATYKRTRRKILLPIFLLLQYWCSAAACRER